MYFFLLISLLVIQLTQAEELLKKGDIDGLKECCEGIEDESFFKGEISFYEKDFDTAVSRYAELPASSLHANDALLRTLIIRQIDRDVLEKYVDAEIAGLKGNYNEALQYIRDGIKMDSSSYGYAALLLSSIHRARDDLAMAVQVLIDAVNLRAGDIFAPYMLKEAFFLYRIMGKNQEAVYVYEKLRIDYPNSPMVSILREAVE